MIKQAAIYHNGIIYKGDRHRNIIESNSNIDLKNGQQGFVTREGLFVNRRQAAQIALACGQIKNAKKELKSEDLY
jgi:hypothetical protein